MIELCSGYLSVRCIWLYVLVMSRTRFRVNPPCSVAWMSRNYLLEAGAIWNFSECIWSPTQNHFARKRTINHLVQLAKWLSCVLGTYLYGAFDCMFLWCHVRVSEWIHLVVLPEYQGTPCTKQAAGNLKFKWLQLDSNPESLSSLITNLRLKAKLCYFPISTST